MSGRFSVLALATMLGLATPVYAQQSYPPLHVRAHHHWHGVEARPCSLDQRDYAYINQCGELIPSVWDRTPVMGG